MKENLKIRYARKNELPTMAQLSVTAFRHSGRQVNAALFPQHLRINPGDSDEIDFSASTMAMNFEKKNHHYIVVADEQEGILGWAEWTSGEDPAVDITPEEREKKRAEGIARLPKSMDLQAAQKLGQEAADLSKRLKEALGEDQYQNSWSLSSVVVDPAHQRKGVGKMLTRWGMERAAEENKAVHFLSSPTGAHLYRAMGFVEVGSGEILGGVENAFIKRAE
ncbi:hypothetical protein KVR01_012990 [Diaporthe batatas]|uniref:uncharacterized protein n=1 Tax=Diaporthe batatas TaxID=748121 RepID=UPI001D045FEC|nr:uncharacterized protein KVR01_012990 [Diaporthe batatas]KAG8157282.1 hypothetical protein KVR01_012990 [Diaporthe batatas]